MAKSTGLDWCDEIFKKVEIYRLSPHARTKKTPFELFRGRRASTLVAPTWVNYLRNAQGANCDGHDWKLADSRKIVARKELYDQRKSVKKTVVKVGDWVLIKNPFKRNSSTAFLKPLQVIKIFNNAVNTADRRIWNLNRVVVVRDDLVPFHPLYKGSGPGSSSGSSVSKDSPAGLKGPNGSCGSNNSRGNLKDSAETSYTIRMSTRVPSSPAYFKDYVK